jgi:hypothetical protein
VHLLDAVLQYESAEEHQFKINNFDTFTDVEFGRKF